MRKLPAGGKPARLHGGDARSVGRGRGADGKVAGRPLAPVPAGMPSEWARGGRAISEAIDGLIGGGDGARAERRMELLSQRARRAPKMWDGRRASPDRESWMAPWHSVTDGWGLGSVRNECARGSSWMGASSDWGRPT